MTEHDHLVDLPENTGGSREPDDKDNNAGITNPIPRKYHIKRFDLTKGEDRKAYCELYELFVSNARYQHVIVERNIEKMYIWAEWWVYDAVETKKPGGKDEKKKRP